MNAVFLSKPTEVLDDRPFFVPLREGCVEWQGRFGRHPAHRRGHLCWQSGSIPGGAGWVRGVLVEPSSCRRRAYRPRVVPRRQDPPAQAQEHQPSPRAPEQGSLGEVGRRDRLVRRSGGARCLIWFVPYRNRQLAN